MYHGSSHSLPCASIVKLNDECLSNKVAPKTIIMYRIIVQSIRCIYSISIC